MAGPLTRTDKPGGFIPNLVFVIMSFDGKMRPIYAAIRNESILLGLEVKRADEITGSVLVINEIKEYLIQAEFIVCDLTGDSHNVYYELGLAHGVGNNSLDIFLVAKVGTTLHFNIAPFQVRYYRSPDHLRELIQTDFKEMIIEKRNREGRV
jgi:hypothetical protein